jgi:hypothetical protein
MAIMNKSRKKTLTKITVTTDPANSSTVKPPAFVPPCRVVESGNLKKGLSA